MVRELELLDLEPENQSGTPEGRLLLPYMRSLGAFPGSCCYQFTPQTPIDVIHASKARVGDQRW